MRRRHVIRVGRFAVADQARRALVAVARSTIAKPAASPIEMPLRAGSNGRHGCERDELERVESEQHAVAERVDAGEDRGVDRAEPDHALGLGEDLRARRARGRDRKARPARAEQRFEEEAERVRRVQYRPAQMFGQALAVERAIAFFGRADAEVEVPTTSATRSAPWRSMQSRAASRKPSAFRPCHASRLLRQSYSAERVRQRPGFEPGHPADSARQRHAREVVLVQAAAVVAQRIAVRAAAVAERGSRGKGGDGEGGDTGRHASKNPAGRRKYDTRVSPARRAASVTRSAFARRRSARREAGHRLRRRAAPAVSAGLLTSGAAPGFSLTA